jgi:hypothetical protein
MPGSDDSIGRETADSSCDGAGFGGAAAAEEDALGGGQLPSVVAQRHVWAACMGQLNKAAGDSLVKMQQVRGHIWKGCLAVWLLSLLAHDVAGGDK